MFKHSKVAAMMRNTSRNLPLSWYCQASSLCYLAQVSKYQSGLSFAWPPCHHSRAKAGRQFPGVDTRVFLVSYVTEVRDDRNAPFACRVFSGKAAPCQGSGEHPRPLLTGLHGQACAAPWCFAVEHEPAAPAP